MCCVQYFSHSCGVLLKSARQLNYKLK
jgi:hypothetical protein